MKTNYQTTLFSIHPLDPFGKKVGGIETHVRQVLRYAPADMRIILIGVDDSGTLPLGELKEVQQDGHSYYFMPVMYTGQQSVNGAAKKLLQSTTLRFFASVARYAPRIRGIAKEMPATADIQRYEFAWLMRLLGLKYVLTTHGDADPNQAMDSLLRRYWFLHEFNEKIAVRSAQHVYSVNQQQTERIKNDYPQVANKTEFMTVSVDDKIFKPTPYTDLNGPLKVAFVGRLDTFKRPGMMFRVIATLAEKTAGAVEFHYVGASDPTIFPEFAAIAARTTRHGFMTSQQVAALWPQLHLGLVTSTFEGMPVYVMEALCCGRPVCSVHLPQLGMMLKAGQSGCVLASNNDSDAVVEELANSMLAYLADMREQRITPEMVNHCVQPFKASVQMSRLFECHSRIQNEGV